MLTKRITRPHPLALRLSNDENLHLLALAELLNRSKTDVIKQLLAEEFRVQEKNHKAALGKVVKKIQDGKLSGQQSKRRNKK